MRNSHWLSFAGVVIPLMALLLVFCSQPAFSASTDYHPPQTAYAWLWIALGIVYLSRRRQIGGWLLYFYVQLYSSALVSLLFVPVLVSSLQPSQWTDKTQYVMFCLGSIPVELVTLFELFAATRLLASRSERNLRILIWSLSALFLSYVTAVVIDLVYFPKSQFGLLDLVGCIFSIIWALYFVRSKRVKAVFVSKDFSFDERHSAAMQNSELSTKQVNTASVVSNPPSLQIPTPAPKASARFTWKIRMNGWRRIGLVLVAGWIFGIVVLMAYEFASRQGGFFMDLWLDVSPEGIVWDDAPALAQIRWIRLLVVGLLTPIFTWAVAELAVIVTLWVKRGFQQA